MFSPVGENGHAPCTVTTPSRSKHYTGSIKHALSQPGGESQLQQDSHPIFKDIKGFN